uniref:acylphosphatase n=1 Tax=Stomoxys calcitrans TaxID=35570 RepID=A0A1I8NLN1_STOCA
MLPIFLAPFTGVFVPFFNHYDSRSQYLITVAGQSKAICKVYNKPTKCLKLCIAPLKYLALCKFTEKQANKLGVRGWCMNTRDDTVKGEIEATPEAFAEMKTWLEKTGSPTSRIDKAVFGETKENSNFTFENFSVRY